MNGIPLIDHVQITGPFAATGSGDTPSRRRVFVCHPANESEELPCAKKRVISTLARRAYRRAGDGGGSPKSSLSFYQKGRNGSVSGSGSF